MGVRRQMGRCEWTAVEHDLVGPMTHHHMPGARQHGEVFDGATCQRRSLPGVVQQRQLEVGAGDRLRPRLGAVDGISQRCGHVMLAAAERCHLSQIVEHLAVVGGAALLVGAVGEDLARKLAIEQSKRSVEQNRAGKASARKRERGSVLQHVVAADVVLHGPG